MAELREATPDQAEFLAELTAAGLLIPSGVPGVYGRGPVFEDIRERFDALVTHAAAPERAESLRFPPLLPRAQLERSGYVKSFPHLAGTVWAFEGHDGDAWDDGLAPTELALMPAVCYPVYPVVAARGPLPAGGVTVDLGAAYAFRHEPSGDPARLQMFHQREVVRIGAPEIVQDWRDGWRDRALGLLRGVGLDADFDVAADPFFGRAGRMLAASQRAQELKWEILAPIAGAEPTALASFNYHQDHFGSAYGISLDDGGVAHTACLGFGHERIVLALLRAHGLDPAAWPEDVRGALGTA